VARTIRHDLLLRRACARFHVTIKSSSPARVIKRLSGRSEQSVEFKHLANISAVLMTWDSLIYWLQASHPNYQGLLR